MSEAGVHLAARRYGSGPALIILHGLFGAARNWHAQAGLLAGHFEVHALDLRNHGVSPHTERMDYPSMAGDVLVYLDTHALDRAHLLGHSMGGKVAMQLALNAPERVDRLLVVDIAPRDYPPHHREILAAMQALDPARLASRQAIEEALRPDIADPVVRQFILTNLVRRGGVLHWQLNLPAIVASYARLSLAPGGSPFAGPCLFLKGGRSDYIGEQDREAITRLFPRARSKVIADAGHWPHAEKPQAFARIARTFLTQAD